MNPHIAFAPLIATLLFSSSVVAQSPPTVNSANILSVTPGDLINHTFTLYAGTPPITWSDFMFASYLPLYGTTGSGPLYPATFDADIQLFAWDTTGSPQGIYEWRVTATNTYGSDEGRLFIHMNIIPEPSSLVLSVLGLMCLGGIVRRRSA